MSGKSVMIEDHVEVEEIAYSEEEAIRVAKQVAQYECFNRELGENLYHYRRRLEEIRDKANRMCDMAEFVWEDIKKDRAKEREKLFEPLLVGENPLFTPYSATGGSSVVDPSPQVLLGDRSSKLEQRNVARTLDFDSIDGNGHRESGETSGIPGVLMGTVRDEHTPVREPVGGWIEDEEEEEEEEEEEVPPILEEPIDDEDSEFEMWEEAPPTPIVISSDEEDPEEEMEVEMQEEEGEEVGDELWDDEEIALLEEILMEEPEEEEQLEMEMSDGEISVVELSSESDDSGDDSDDPDFSPVTYRQRTDYRDVFVI